MHRNAGDSVVVEIFIVDQKCGGIKALFALKTLHGSTKTARGQ
jgi:hypothetical protein